MNFERNVGSGAATYQESLVRDDLTATSLAKDLAYNVEASAGFWRWSDGLSSGAGDLSTALAGLAAASVLVAGVLFVGLVAPHPPSRSHGDRLR